MMRMLHSFQYRQVFDDLKATKYSLSEPRISIYGRNNKEWSRLGAWFCRFKVASFNVRWMIQIPRLYHVWNTNGSVANFQVQGLHKDSLSLCIRCGRNGRS